MYVGTPVALVAAVVALRHGNSRLVARSVAVLVLFEAAFLLMVTVLGVWASGIAFFWALLGIPA